jgi:hypothetical protein
MLPNTAPLRGMLRDVHRTLETAASRRARFQAFFYASAFSTLDGVPPSAPAPVTRAVGPLRSKAFSDDSKGVKYALDTGRCRGIKKATREGVHTKGVSGIAHVHDGAANLLREQIRRFCGLRSLPSSNWI